MKNVDVGQTISILANLGVIAGIVFLAVEIRQGNELLQSEASAAYVDMRASGIHDWGEDREHLSTLLKAWAGEELTPVESLSLDFRYWSMFVNWEWEYEQYLKGTLDVLNQTPDLRWRPVVDYYPFLRESWEIHKDTLSPEFVEYMETQVLN